MVRILATWGPLRAPQRLELIKEVLSYEPAGRAAGLRPVPARHRALRGVRTAAGGRDDAAVCGRGRRAAPHRRGDPTRLVALRTGARRRRPECPGARPHGVRPAPPERLHRGPRAGVPAARSGGTRPARRSPPRWSRWRARPSPASARWWPMRSSSPVTPPRRTPSSGTRHHPAPWSTPCSPATACACWCWPRPASAGGGPAGARADHGVRRTGGHLRHRRPPRLRRPLPGDRVRRPGSRAPRARRRARPAGRRTQRAAGVPAVEAPGRGTGGAARVGGAGFPDVRGFLRLAGESARPPQVSRTSGETASRLQSGASERQEACKRGHPLSCHRFEGEPIDPRGTPHVRHHHPRHPAHDAAHPGRPGRQPDPRAGGPAPSRRRPAAHPGRRAPGTPCVRRGSSTSRSTRWPSSRSTTPTT